MRYLSHVTGDQTFAAKTMKFYAPQPRFYAAKNGKREGLSSAPGDGARLQELRRARAPEKSKKREPKIRSIRSKIRSSKAVAQLLRARQRKNHLWQLGVEVVPGLQISEGLEETTEVQMATLSTSTC